MHLRSGNRRNLLDHLVRRTRGVGSQHATECLMCFRYTVWP